MPIKIIHVTINAYPARLQQQFRMTFLNWKTISNNYFLIKFFKFAFTRFAQLLDQILTELMAKLDIKPWYTGWPKSNTSEKNAGQKLKNKQKEGSSSRLWFPMFVLHNNKQILVPLTYFLFKKDKKIMSFKYTPKQRAFIVEHKRWVYIGTRTHERGMRKQCVRSCG